MHQAYNSPSQRFKPLMKCLPATSKSPSSEKLRLRTRISPIIASRGSCNGLGQTRIALDSGRGNLHSCRLVAWFRKVCNSACYRYCTLAGFPEILPGYNILLYSELALSFSEKCPTMRYQQRVALHTLSEPASSRQLFNQESKAGNCNGGGYL